MLAVLGITFFLVSVIFTMFGFGGGSLYVPILLAYSISYPVAAGTSLLLILVGAVSASVIYARSGLIDWKFVLAVNLFSDMAAFFGGGARFSPGLLRALLGLVLLFSGTLMFREPSFKPYKPSRHGFFVWDHQFAGNTYRVPLPLVLIVFGFVGFWSGVLGIGGGVFKIPIMVLLCGFPLHIAIATSSLMIATSSFWGVMGHLNAGTVNLEIGLPLALIVLIGGQIGSRISVKTGKGRLRQGFAVILFMVALKMLSPVLF